MESTKISFGFSKLSRKNIISQSNSLKREEKKVELIECLEGQSIKIKDAVEEVVQPLVIPLRDDQKNLLDRIKSAKKKDQQKSEAEDTRPDSELTSDELVARQLIKEAKDRLTNGSSANSNKLTVLPLKEAELSLEGEKEPTLEDYESIPISDYGKALLRGMGWKEGMPIGKNVSKSALVSVPELRPKGLGLGASKAVQSGMPMKKATDKDGNELTLVKKGFAKVIAGPQKGNYCEIQGFDEEAGRVIIKVYPNGEIVNINELMLTPVTREEFSKGSKILNNAKYEEYKEISDKRLDNYKVKSEPSYSKIVKKESRSSSGSEAEDKLESANSSLKRMDGKRRSDLPHNEEVKERSSKQRERSESPSDYRKSSKNRNKSERNSRSRSRDRSKKYASSDDGEYSQKRSKNRSRSNSKYNSKKDKGKHSSEEEYYKKEKKNKKHSKSKNRDRSRSESRDKSKKNKKHSRNRDSSETDSDRKDRRKKNKCKSRHRRNSSSSSEGRGHKTKR